MCCVHICGCVRSVYSYENWTQSGEAVIIFFFVVSYSIHIHSFSTSVRIFRMKTFHQTVSVQKRYHLSPSSHWMGKYRRWTDHWANQRIPKRKNRKEERSQPSLLFKNEINGQFHLHIPLFHVIRCNCWAHRGNAYITIHAAYTGQKEEAATEPRRDAAECVASAVAGKTNFAVVIIIYRL